jgi:hypothetical protein
MCFVVACSTFLEEVPLKRGSKESLTLANLDALGEHLQARYPMIKVYLRLFISLCHFVEFGGWVLYFEE